MEGYQREMTAHIPTQEQMAAIIEAKMEHAQKCQHTPVFDLSNISLTVRCMCGWTYQIEFTREDRE